VLLLAAALAGCGEVPRPFSHSKLDPVNPLLDLRDGAGLQVAPLAGVDPGLAIPVSQALAVELQKLNIPAAADPAFNGRYVLHGTRKPLVLDASGQAKADIEWKLTDRRGAVLGIIDQTIRGDTAGWAAADPNLIRVLVADAAPAISNFLSERVTARPLAPPSFVVTRIAGAPGDGAVSLERALKFHLQRQGYVATTDRAKATFHIEADIVLEPEGQQQNLALVWQVADATGKELGKVRQANQVPTGQLNGRWGEMAFAVAAGASEGIAEVMRQTKTDSP
jgi:hypothetical protein